YNIWHKFVNILADDPVKVGICQHFFLDIDAGSDDSGVSHCLFRKSVTIELNLAACSTKNIWLPPAISSSLALGIAAARFIEFRAGTIVSLWPEIGRAHV